MGIQTLENELLVLKQEIQVKLMNWIQDSDWELKDQLKLMNSNLEDQINETLEGLEQRIFSIAAEINSKIDDINDRISQFEEDADYNE